MILSLILAVSPADAASYLSTTVATLGRGSSLASVVMSDSGDVCFGTYGRSGAAVSHWSPGDGAATEVMSSSIGGTSVGCTAQTSTGYSTIYAYTSTGFAGYLYDSYTDELYPLASGSADYAYAAAVNDDGYSAGPVFNTSTGVSAVGWWGPTGGEATVLNLGEYDGVYTAGIDDDNRVIAYGSSYTRFGTVTDLAAYDIDRGSWQAFPGEVPRNTYPTMGKDGDVLLSGYAGPTLKWNIDSDDVDYITSNPFATTSVMATGSSGDVLLYSYEPDGTTTSACWSDAHGAVPLEMPAGSYGYGLAVNGAGQVAGYAYDGTSYNVQALLWDCDTGVATEIPTPGSLTYLYPQYITDDGLVVLYGYDASYQPSLWTYDTRTGAERRIAGGSSTTSVYAYAVSSETDDILVYEYNSTTGRGSRLSYLHRVD